MARPRLRDIDPETPPTSERLLAEAERLFAAHGFAGVSLRDIGKAATLSNAALLHYYPSKEKLYRAVLDAVASDLEAAISPALDSGRLPLHRLQAMFVGAGGWGGRSPARPRRVMRERTDNPGRFANARHFAMARLIDGMSRVIVDGQRAGAFRRCDPQIFVFHMIGSLSYFANGLPTIAGVVAREPESLWQTHRRQAWAHLRLALVQD